MSLFNRVVGDRLVETDGAPGPVPPKGEEGALVKGATVTAKKGAATITGRVMWLGTSKFGAHEMTYGLSVAGAPKLVYVTKQQILSVVAPPTPAAAKVSFKTQSTPWWDHEDAARDMNLELGRSANAPVSRSALGNYWTGKKKKYW